VTSDTRLVVASPLAEWLLAHSVMGTASAAADAASAAVLRAHAAVEMALGVAQPTSCTNTTTTCEPLTCRPCMPVGVSMPLGVASHAGKAMPSDAWAVWGRGVAVSLLPRLQCDENPLHIPSLSGGGRESRQNQVAIEGLLALSGSPSDCGSDMHVQVMSAELHIPMGPALKPPPPQQQQEQQPAGLCAVRPRRVTEPAPRVSNASAGGSSCKLDVGGDALKRTTGADRSTRFIAKHGNPPHEGLQTARKSRKLLAASSAGGGDAAEGQCVMAKATDDDVGSPLFLWSLPQLRGAFASCYGRASTSKNKEWLVRRLRESGFTATAAGDEVGMAGAAVTELYAADDAPEDTVCGGDGSSSDEDDVAPHLSPQFM
jgi:hypothetical protein